MWCLCIWLWHYCLPRDARLMIMISNHNVSFSFCGKGEKYLAFWVSQTERQQYSDGTRVSHTRRQRNVCFECDAACLTITFRNQQTSFVFMGCLVLLNHLWFYFQSLTPPISAYSLCRSLRSLHRPLRFTAPLLQFPMFVLSPPPSLDSSLHIYHCSSTSGPDRTTEERRTATAARWKI